MIAPGHPCAGLIRVDDRAATDLLADRRVRRSGALDQPPQGVLDPTLADREPEHVPTDLHQPLVADVMPLVEVREQCLNAGAERPPGLQPGRIGAGGPLATLLAGHRVLPRFDHHWHERWHIDDLAPSDPTPPGRGQLMATAATRARPACHHDVRLTTLPTDPNVPPLRPPLPTPTDGPAGLLPARR